jgi:hypothetical protein
VRRLAEVGRLVLEEVALLLLVVVLVAVVVL